MRPLSRRHDAGGHRAAAREAQHGNVLELPPPETTRLRIALHATTKRARSMAEPHGSARLFPDSVGDLRRALTTRLRKESDKLMPLLVPEHEIVPGEEQWHPAVCTACSAGCGTLVARHGRRARHPATRASRFASASPRSRRSKAIRSIPSAAADCARADRLRFRRYIIRIVCAVPCSVRASAAAAQFAAISWDAAIASASEKIAKARAAIPARS